MYVLWYNFISIQCALVFIQAVNAIYWVSVKYKHLQNLVSRGKNDKYKKIRKNINLLLLLKKINIYLTWFLLRNWKPRILSVHPPIKIWRQISLAFVRSFHLSFKSILQINLIFFISWRGYACLTILLFRWWLCHNAGNNCYIKAWAASRTLICSLRHHLIFFSFIHKLQGPGSKDSALVYHKITPQYIKLNGRNLCWLVAYCLEQTFCFQGCP